MKIKINDNAASNYVRRCYRHASPSCGMLHRPEWETMLSKVQGKWLEVETDYLFDDQFNTVPIPGVSELGMRIMIEDVTAIVDDVRPVMLKCKWCGHHQPSIDGGLCWHCGKSEYIAPFKLNRHNTRKEKI